MAENELSHLVNTVRESAKEKAKKKRDSSFFIYIMYIVAVLLLFLLFFMRHNFFFHFRRTYKFLLFSPHERCNELKECDDKSSDSSVLIQPLQSFTDACT